MIELIVMAALAKAPVIAPDHKLSCPTGTKQVRTSSLVACDEGGRVFHGPYISLYADGKVEAVGQSEHGFRSGKWSFYDAKGTLVGETEFKRGNFHGRRVFYNPDGSLKSEETYATGQLVTVSGPGGPTRTTR